MLDSGGLTPNPLVWEFSRVIPSGVKTLGGVMHYYDETSQSIYVTPTGLSTQLADVPDGHWRESVLGDRINVKQQNITLLRIDHTVNGTLYMVLLVGGSLRYARYHYAMDISSLMDDWSWTDQIDNAISGFNGSVQNIGPLVFSDDLTLFQPGSRIRLAIRAGESDIYRIGVAWLDEADLDIRAETISISGRNSIGYFLKDQTFDDIFDYSGTSSDIAASILDYAGVRNYMIQTEAMSPGFIFDPSMTLLDGIQGMIDYHTYENKLWKIVELFDGTILIGYDDWISDRQSNGLYSFDEGAEVFKRKTSKMSDSSYTSLRVTGKNKDDEELTAVTVPIENFQYWGLGKHRTKHLTAPDGLTQAELSSWANTKARIYQYIGIGEDFSGPLRPNLLVGDVAEVLSGSIGTSLGLITEVTHSFGRSSGYVTDFSVDSGGVTTDGANYIIYSRAAEVGGFNRRQRMIDLVRLVSK